MEMIITTTYSNIDQEWLDWYLKRLANEEALPGSTLIIKDLKSCGQAAFTSKDPTSDVIATTEYEIIK